jgi:hypothetical protein
MLLYESNNLVESSIGVLGASSSLFVGRLDLFLDK